ARARGRWAPRGRRERRCPARAWAPDARRKPWSTVIAMSFGPRFNALRQRAISINSAVESGPPETARTRAGTRASGANNAFASAAETGAASSAADTLLFSLDPLPHRGRCARKFAQDFSERRAGRLLLAERGKRLSEAQQRIGRLGGGFVFGRDIEEGFRRLAEAAALEHAFAEPIGGVAGEPIIGIFAQEAVEGIFSERVVLAQHIAVGEIVFVARGLGGSGRGALGGGGGGARAGELCGVGPGSAPLGGPTVARSRGAAALRPPRAPIGGSPASAPMTGGPPG